MDGAAVSYLHSSADKQEGGLRLGAGRRAIVGGTWKVLDDFVEIEFGKRSDPQARQGACGSPVHQDVIDVLIA